MRRHFWPQKTRLPELKEMLVGIENCRAREPWLRGWSPHLLTLELCSSNLLDFERKQRGVCVRVSLLKRRLVSGMNLLLAHGGASGSPVGCPPKKCLPPAPSSVFSGHGRKASPSALHVTSLLSFSLRIQRTSHFPRRLVSSEVLTRGIAAGTAGEVRRGAGAGLGVFLSFSE